MATTSASRRRDGDRHTITSVHFGENRRVACACGARLRGFDSDDDMAEAFQRHRVAHGAPRRSMSDVVPYGDGVTWSERFAGRFAA